MLDVRKLTWPLKSRLCIAALATESEGTLNDVAGSALKAAAASSLMGSGITGEFIDALTACVPLYDIGKVGLPDHILMKPGKFTAEERMLMEAHTTVGAETIAEVIKETGGGAAGFLQMASDIARHHHERYDGKGYPDRLAGDAIPLAARIVAICHVYDALRSRRSYRPALSHATALQLVLEGSPGQFDPVLLNVFQRCAPEFERITNDMGNSV